MAQGLMNLSNLLGQSSNATQGGLIGGGVFSQPMSRGQRRSKLLTDAISGAGANPYARLGASFGGLIGMGARAGAEGLGIVDKPQEVQRAEAIRQVQDEVRQQGLDPMQNPGEFGETVSNRFQELGYPDLALRTQMQIRQMMPEPTELPAESRNLAFRAREAGLEPGTEEYTRFMRSGGEASGQSELDPATFFNPDTGEYVQGAYANGTPVNPRTGAPLPTNLVERDYEEGASQKGKARNVRLPNGEFIRGIERPDGTLVDTQGRVLPEEATIVGLSLEATGQEDLPESTVEQLNTRQLGVENYTDLVNEAIGIFNQNPSVNSLAAEGSKLLREVRSEFNSFLDLTGVDLKEGITKTSLLDPSNYNSTFDEIGLENAALKPLYLSLALQQAQTEAQQSGRALSDSDVTRFLRQQGNNYSDPEIATEILTRNARRLQRRFKNEYEIRTDSDFTQEFQPIREYNPSTPTPEGAESDTEETETVNWDDL